MAEPPADDDAAVRLTGRSCALCGRPALRRFRPFCSRRCADLDLGRWLNEDYRIPGSAEDEDEPPPAED